jgi:hypothetical protein
MRRTVIVEEHRDDDPHEARDSWHGHDPVERCGQHGTDGLFRLTSGHRPMQDLIGRVRFEALNQHATSPGAGDAGGGWCKARDGVGAAA